MKCTIPEISWHNRCQVLSLDILNGDNNGTYKLVTGGLDNHVIIWQLSVSQNGAVQVEMLSDLTRHNRAVNAVRFSPDGQILASADDEAALILWKCNNSTTSDIFMDDGEQDNKEHWSVFKMLRGHIEDISDLCWSECSQFLISGSVDNSAILWDVSKGKNIGLLKDHNGFVQGVSWDPQGQFVVTLCSDRILRFYNVSTKKVVQKVFKANLMSQLQKNEDTTVKLSHLFHDDTLKSFCRRLSFSPEGEFLLVPSGILEDGDGKLGNVVYLFSRLCLSKPVMYYPTNAKYSVAVRFCPTLFKHKNVDYTQEGSKENGLFHLPYRMVFAVATQNSVLLYDTQQQIPFAMVSDIHYTRLTDLSWSSDGRILAVSSTDGYCSLISFSENEIGIPYSKKKIVKLCAPQVTPITPVIPIQKENIEVKSTVDCNKKTPTTIQNTKRKGKRVQLVTLSTNTNKVPVESEAGSLKGGMKAIPVSPKPSTSSATSENAPSAVGALVDSAKKKVVRRVSLITLSSPKSSKKKQSTNDS